MSNILEQTLFVPDLINIEFRDKNDNPFQRADILIGIQTYASCRNDIGIFPFLSDINGRLSITKLQINARADDFISYGIMDYTDLHFAKPGIEIIYWGNKTLRRYLGYDTDPALLENLQKFVPGFNEEDFKKQRIDQHKQDNNYLSFIDSFNMSASIEDDIMLVKDDWNRPLQEVSYICRLPV